MRCGMFVRRVIAAAHVPAFEAMTQVHPLGAHLQTFLAAFSRRLFRGDRCDMITVCHF